MAAFLVQSKMKRAAPRRALWGDAIEVVEVSVGARALRAGHHLRMPSS
ncbi:MAG: hypothetical protein KF764_06655 [Labilithrix sp.]|nr:hypothetical protein [Labilithrix sp.]